jgi:Fe-S cluster biogenesis protein NfuA
MAIDIKSIEEKVVNAIEQLRPFLHADGGDMELVEVKEDATVVVKLLGACSDCSMSMMTLKAGLEESVKKAAPEVKEVIAMNMAEIV